MRLLIAGVLLGLGLAVPAGAATHPLGDFDARKGERVSLPRAVEGARARVDDRLGDQGTVATERRTGGLRALLRTDGVVAGPERGDAARVALDYVRAHPHLTGLDGDDLDRLRLAARYRDVHGITHITWRQTSAGLESYDTTLTVNLGRQNEILNIVGGAVSDLRVNATAPVVGATGALAIAKAEVGGALAPPPRARRARDRARATTFSNGDTARLVVVADADGDRLAWKLTVAGPDPFLYEVVVDALNGEVLARHSLTNFVANASVFDNHPGAAAGGTAHTVDLEADPAWLNDSAGKTRLRGANAHAYADVDSGNDADPAEEVASSGGNWSFAQQSVPCGAGQTASTFSGVCTWNGVDLATETTNRAQTTTQLFYFVNTFHDWLKAAPIGFDAASHNFEGVDLVLAEADDGAGFNNANMNTPPDGLSPRMQMFLFKGPFPAVNSGDDAGIVYHEYTHGLSNRLHNNGLGGGLLAKQSRAMGEGWSDWFAMDYLVEHGHDTDTAADGEIVVGAYLTNNANAGIRFNALDCPVGSANATNCPGSPNAGAGGFGFEDMGRIGRFNNDPDLAFFEEHNEGELWAETLWDLRRAIGGAAARGLITQGMRLAPIPPSMLDARDAILLADAAAGGTHHDTIWSVFAARGMGVGATTTGPGATSGVASTAVPSTAARTGRMTVTDPAPLGDGDGAAEPGETVRVAIAVRNLTPAGLNVGAARLSSPTAGVVVGAPTVDYGTIGGEASVTPAQTFAVTVPAAQPCATPVDLSLRITPSLTATLKLLLGQRTGATFIATDVPKTIPNFSVPGAVSSLTVPGGEPVIDTLSVHVTLAHNNIGDLHGRLISPGGEQVVLFERPGATNGGSPGNDMNVDLLDAATESIQDRPLTPTTLSTVGPFRPNQPLSVYAGDALSGSWTLRVFDVANNGVGGTLTGWSLTNGLPTCATTAATLPVATSAPADGITHAAATLHGTVDPMGTQTEYAFQYGTSDEYGQQTTPASAGSSTGPVARSAAVSGLAANTLYHFRTVALRNGTVIAAGADQTFTTAQPPVAVTTAASSITDTGATLNGTVDAMGVATDYRFEYGPDTNYGIQTAVTDAGAAVGAVGRSAAVTGLTPSTEYHFRILALRGGVVVAQGADTTFTTLAAVTPTPTVTASPTATTSPGGGGDGGGNTTPTPTATATVGVSPTPTVAPPVIHVTNVSKRLRFNKKRRATLRFSASPVAAKGTLAVRARRKGRRKAFAVARGSFTVPAGGAVAVKLRASKKAYRKLRTKAAKADVTIVLAGRTFKLPIAVRR